MNANQNAKLKQAHCKAILQDIESHFKYVGNSDVPARLGLKAPALACSDPRLGQSHHSGLGLGLAQPRPQPVYVQTSHVIQQKLSFP